MSIFYSTNVIMAAYTTLEAAQVSSTDLSALRYFFALDEFKKSYNKDCNLRNPTDKEAFCGFVANVVAINGEDEHDYINDFNRTKPRKPKLNNQISSNFFTANAVRQSRGKQDEPYPANKNEYLIKISDEVLETKSMNYDHLDKFLTTKESRCAFALWTIRYDNLDDSVESMDARLKRAFQARYSDDMVKAIWKDDTFTFGDVGFNNEDAYDSRKPALSWQLIQGPSDHRKILDVPHNLIYFGAPGTGKSHQLNLRAVGDENVTGLFPKENVRRVTFHPDYTYAQFVGCFRPYIERLIEFS